MPEQMQSSKPTLHSRISIIVFSFLLSTVFGAIMYSQNLSAIEKRKERIQVILFSVVWQLIMFKLLKDIIEYPIVSVFLINLIGGFIIAKPIWDYHYQAISYRSTYLFKRLHTSVAL